MTTSQPSGIYRDLRETASQLVLDAGANGWAKVVPATPEWTVHDVMAHMAGICVDTKNFNVADLGSDAWTSAQVDPRRETPTPDVIEEWARESEGVEAMVDTWDENTVYVLLADAVAHLIDVQIALGLEPTLTDHPAAEISIAGITRSLARRQEKRGVAPLEFVTPAGSYGQIGADARVEFPSRFELLRTVTGRRTPDEIAAFEWVGAEPADYPGILISRYEIADRSLGES